MGLQSLAANRDLSFKEIDTYISQQNLFAGMSSQEREGFVNSLKDALLWVFNPLLRIEICPLRR